MLLCMLDTGFYRHHEALNHLRILAEWDFVHGDSITENQPGQDSLNQDEHGTITLSTVGGFKEGNLIGPAYGALFALAKTEWVPSETQIEEDWWTQGIEWADSLGAEVVSSSLGYTDWYTYEWMNGDSCVTTIAADIAASKGIVVCNAMGNQGNYQGSIIAPADADSILAVGAVDSSGNLAGFSSIGPTYDGRTKPEVVAQGAATYCVWPYDSTSYLRASGTSLSTPLIAGVAALVRDAHPEWSAMKVREALLMSASQARSPDNHKGWGIPNALRAINYIVPAVPDSLGVSSLGGGIGLTWRAVVTNQDSTPITDLAGYNIYRRGQGEEYGNTPLNPSVVPSNAYFDSTALAESTYYYTVTAVDTFGFESQRSSQVSGVWTGIAASFPPAALPGRLWLGQGSPNPFSFSTRISFGLPSAPEKGALTKTRVILRIYNALGQFVRTLLSGSLDPGQHLVYWDGRTEDGREARGGVYFCRLEAGDQIRSRRLVVLR